MTDGAGVVRSAGSLAHAGRTVAQVVRRRGPAAADRAAGRAGQPASPRPAACWPRPPCAPRPGGRTPGATSRGRRMRWRCRHRPRRRGRTSLSAPPPATRGRTRPGSRAGDAPTPGPRPTPPWTPVLDPPRVAVVDAVARAIAEDLLPLGDLTAGLVAADRRATVDLVSRADGVVAGRACAVEAFAQIDPDVSGRPGAGPTARRWPRATSWPRSRARCARSSRPSGRPSTSWVTCRGWPR